jgi:hypothetical protein
MTGILQVAFGLLLAGAVLASAIYVSRRSHAGREPRAAGTAAVSPVRHQAAGGMAVPAVTAYPQPSAIERVPYDGGPLIGGSL